MEAAAIINQLNNIGVDITLVNDRLRFEPGSLVPEEIISEIKVRKRDIIAMLKKGYRLAYSINPHESPCNSELKEIERRVEAKGYILLWSNLLCDLVAFYRDAEALEKIPPGFIPYSKAELRELFGKDPPNEQGLRLIHEAKKHGANITDSPE